MDVAEARRVLGLGPTPSWGEVRIAYRAQIRAAHPDRAGGSTARAALVNHAYATLEAVDRMGARPDQDHAHDHPQSPAPPPARPPRPCN